MKFSAAVNRKWGWYESIRSDWNLLHLHITDGSCFFILLRLCRELQRGWLITIRSVIHPIGHGMEPMIFWTAFSGRGRNDNLFYLRCQLWNMFLLKKDLYLMFHKL